MTRQDGFRHEAVIYGDADDFLAATLPFLRAGLEAGEPALVAVRAANAELLEGELGADAAAAVRFADTAALGANPARLIPFWRDFVGEHGGEPVRGVGEPIWPGLEPDHLDECGRHESLLNRAFASPPDWSLLCSYDAGGLSDEVLGAVGHSHRVVASGEPERWASRYDEDRDCFSGELSAAGDPGEGFGFDRTGLFDVRERVRRAAQSAGLPERAATDLVVAASELAANSIVHGGGSGTLYVWRQGGRLLVEVEDRGRITDPMVGRVRPDPTQVGGRGLWLANQFCDLVQIRSGESGTAVRLQMAIA